jgi:hypothetical protein
MKPVTISMGPTMCNPDAISDIKVLRKVLERANVTMINQSSALHTLNDLAHTQSMCLVELIAAHDANNYDEVRRHLAVLSRLHGQAKAEKTSAAPATKQHQQNNREPADVLAARDTARLNHLIEMDHEFIGYVNEVDTSAGTVHKVAFIYENLTGAVPTEAVRGALDRSMLLQQQRKNGSLH